MLLRTALFTLRAKHAPSEDEVCMLEELEHTATEDAVLREREQMEFLQGEGRMDYPGWMS